MRLASLCAVVLVTACRSVQSGSASDGGPLAAMRNGANESVGDLHVMQVANGVRITGQLFNIAAGVHGIHFHEKGQCDSPSFESAGAHFNPAGREHGLENTAGPHAGDLPNITVAEPGRTTVDIVTPRLTLDSAATTGAFDADGTAIIIHAAADDQRTNPSGNSGARIACGVIRRN